MKTSSKKKGKSKRARPNKDLYGFFSEEKRSHYLQGVATIDTKDGELLKKFTTEHGKILPRRITGVSAKQQRQLRRAIHRARIMGLI